MADTTHHEVGQAEPDSWLGLDWLRLLLIAGTVASVVSTSVAIYLTDLEGGVVALVFIVSTWLFARKRRLLGVVGLLVMSAITTFFMTTAALVNFRGYGGIEGLAIAGGLAAVSNLLLLAAIGYLIRRDHRASFGPWLAVGYVAITLIQALTGGGTMREVEPEASDISLVAEDVAFSSIELAAAAGDLIVSLENRDLFWHTFTVEDLGVDLRVPVGAEMTVEFDAPPGEYVFICAVPGHPEAGMKGVLTVHG
jgi:plastocyanin